MDRNQLDKKERGKEANPSPFPWPIFDIYRVNGERIVIPDLLATLIFHALMYSS